MPDLTIITTLKWSHFSRNEAHENESLYNNDRWHFNSSLNTFRYWKLFLEPNPYDILNEAGRLMIDQPKAFECKAKEYMKGNDI